MRYPSTYLGYALLILYGLSFTGCINEQADDRPPNIVLILVDDLGWADLPGYGNQFNESPHIDRLIREGMQFTDAYAAAPVCSPTRASIQSGQYPARVGITDFITGHWRPYEQLAVPTNRTQYLPLEVVTIPEKLKEKGYVSGYYGKWHLDTRGTEGHRPGDQGYDSVVVHRGGGHFDLANKLIPPQEIDPDVYLTTALTDYSEAFIEAHQNQSFFLMLSHYAVHIPLEAESDKIAKYENKPPPEKGINHPVYAAMIEHVDDSVGRIVKKLEELGLSEHTMLVFISDNGGLSERFDKADGVVVTTNEPLRNVKGSLYEGGIRVPLIVSWPGRIEAGSTSSYPVSSVDIYPTFMDIAGVDVDDVMLDGESLLPVLEGRKMASDRALFFHYPHYHHSTPSSAIRKGAYKLIEFFDTGHLELYNLREDISETNNLAQELPEITQQLHETLGDWRETVHAELPEINPGFDVSRRLEWGRHPDRQ